MSVDTTDMVLVHRFLLREIGRLPDLIRSTPGDRRRSRRLGAHAAEMLDILHHHHTGEDELLWPVLRPRIQLDAAVIDRMEQQHESIEAAVAAVAADLRTWTDSADPASAGQVAYGLSHLHDLLVEHLGDEEAQVLPLASEHLTQAEWDAIGEHGLLSIPAKRRLVVLGHLLEEAGPDERRAFLLHVPAPAVLAFRLFGRRLHAREVAAVRG